MGRALTLSTKTEVPNLWDLMSYGLRRSWFNNNRNKVHNRCNALESSQTIPPPWFVEKLSSTKQVPLAKKVEERCTKRPEEIMWEGRPSRSRALGTEFSKCNLGVKALRSKSIVEGPLFNSISLLSSFQIQLQLEVILEHIWSWNNTHHTQHDNLFPLISKVMSAHFRKFRKYVGYLEEIKDNPLLVEWYISFCSFSKYMCLWGFGFLLTFSFSKWDDLGEWYCNMYTIM